MKRPTSYLAIVLINAGSSYATASSMRLALDRVADIIKRDWGSTYNVAGAEMIANIYDASGVEDMHWDHSGAYNTKTGERLHKIGERHIKIP